MGSRHFRETRPRRKGSDHPIEPVPLKSRNRSVVSGGGVGAEKENNRRENSSPELPIASSEMTILSHDFEFRVRYQETDAQGRAHHANYFTWFEMGRVELLRAAGYSYREFEEQGIMLVVIDIQAKYRAPANYDDLLRLRTTTVRSWGVRINHEYELFCGEKKLAEGKSTIACVDRTGSVCRLPDWLQMPGS